MQVHYDIHTLPAFEKAIVTTGTFDGVHRGHQQLIARIKQYAKDINGQSVIITFNPHPRLVLNPQDQSLRVLTTLDEKIELLSQSGIDHLVIVPFTLEFSSLSAHDYISKFLVDKFKPAAIALGYNHNFGHHRDGNIELLKKMGTQYGYDVVEISKQIVDEIDVSSTRIRLALTDGDLTVAAHLLGRPYSFSGEVGKGKQLGRQIGFPTANINIADPYKLVPSNGIYAVLTHIDSTTFKGAMNIGTRPTVDDSNYRTIEVNLFDFNKNIYGTTVKVDCIHYLRPELKFDGLESLKAHIAQDVENAKALLA